MLTKRQRQILQLYAEGLRMAQIGDELWLTEATIRSHLVNARERLGAKSLGHLVALAVWTGQISLDREVSLAA